MVFSYNWLQQYIGEKLPSPEKVAHLLTMHAFEVEEVVKKGKDTLFDIAILPNRTHDCQSHLGIAREIAAITAKKLEAPKRKKILARKTELAPLSVSLEDSERIPRYSALVIKGVRIAKSPPWVVNLLRAVGVRSINNIVDLTNFVMLEMNQPLHVFDYDRIRGHRMNIRKARKGERIETLDDRVLSLPEHALVIEDDRGLIDLAGIKGGKRTIISSSTEHIVLQAANFDASSIYKTKKALRYSTQAAEIYAHGIDPHLTREALERACFLLSEFGIGGTVSQIIDIYPHKSQQRNIVLDRPFAESLLGASISSRELRKILGRLSCKVAGKKDRFRVTPPSWRLDLALPEDVVEEIGRIRGYEAIGAVFPTVPLTPPEKNAEFLWLEKMRDALKTLGCTEVYTYSFIGKKDILQFLYSEEDQKKLIELENPISEDFSHLRDSLLENLLKIVRDNQKHRETIRIFEIGKVFQKEGQNLQETTTGGALLFGGSFYEMKGMCDFLLETLGIAHGWYDDYGQTPKQTRTVLWKEGKSAEVKVNSEKIGFIGEISSSILSKLKIVKEVAALHLNAQKLAQLATEERSYEPPSKFPAVTRDIAVLVPRTTKVAELMNVIHGVAGKVVADVDLFDMYEGEELPEGKKNLAFHLIYESDERTLTDTEVHAFHEKVIQAIEENPEWEVRK